MRSTGKKLAKTYFQEFPREVVVLTTVAFFVALGYGMVVPIIPVFAKSFGVTTFAATTVVSVFAAMRLIAATPGGRLVNIFGERLILWIGLSIVAISTLLAGLSQTFTQLLVLRGMGGLGSVMFSISSMSLLMRSVDSDKRGRASSTYQGGFLLGSLAGPAIGGLIVNTNIRAPFFIYAGTLVLAAFTAYFALPKGLGKPSINDSKSNSETLPVAQAMKLRSYWAAMVANLANGFSSFGLRVALIPLFVIEVLNGDPRLASLGFLVAAITQALMLWPAGRVSDLSSRKAAMLVGSFLLIVGLLFIIINESKLIYFVSMALMGAAAAFLTAGPSATIGDIVGERRGGPVVASYQMTNDFGAVVGPLILGALHDLTGGYTAPFILAFVIVVISTIVTSTMPNSKKLVS
jgi:DHA1 family multidrug resistance protein-like MFS transporter